MPERAKRKGIATISLALFVLLIFMVLAASLGVSELSFQASLGLILEKLTGKKLGIIKDLDPVYQVIVFKVRWPRIILSVLAGSSLAMVGATYQSIFVNSLADPHILGISSGAALGAAVAMVFGFKSTALGLSAIALFAFAGGLIAIFLLYLITPHSLKNDSSRILLAGIALSSLFSALISLLMLFDQERIAGIYYWLMGSFSSATWAKVIMLTIIFIPLGALIYYHAPEMNVMLSGDEEAASLGVDARRIRWRLIFMATFLVGAVVSASGVVGFVGLIVPHFLRLLKINNLKYLLPASAVCGAIFTLFCDSIARLAIPPTELPVGVITAFFGVPLFLSLLYRSGREY
ncbi:MAG: iron ABC transporter permease [Eubacteriales bacterium]|nr:iron ABC transporter permease [Eubacteriales bacterium]